MSDSEQPASPSGNHTIEKEPEKAGNQAGASNAPAVLHKNDAEKATQPKHPGNDAPDGGTLAWLVALGAWCASFCTFGWLNSMTGSYRIKAYGFMLYTDENQVLESSRSTTKMSCSATTHQAPSPGFHHCKSFS